MGPNFAQRWLAQRPAAATQPRFFLSSLYSFYSFLLVAACLFNLSSFRIFQIDMELRRSYYFPRLEREHNAEGEICFVFCYQFAAKKDERKISRKKRLAIPAILASKDGKFFFVNHGQALMF